MTDLEHTVERIFAPGGALSSLSGFEHRPQQGVMAQAIARALECREHLIVEAPTGIGKSLAYLVPAALYAAEAHRKAVISTHTKNLQEQLFRKDILLLQSALGRACNAVVLKGRRNYLCTTRLRNAVDAKKSLFADSEQQELQLIDVWSRSTLDGDVEGLGFAPLAEVWEMVCSEKGVCSRAVCGPSCFFQQAKDRVRGADVVIMNHALFFTLMSLQGTDERYIFDGDFVVFDEAHMLEAVAGMGIGRRLSRYHVLSAIRRLLSYKTGRGLFARHKRKLGPLCEDAEEAAVDFFDTVRRNCAALADAGVTPARPARQVRLRVPHIAGNTLAQPLGNLRAAVNTLQEKARSAAEKQEIGAGAESLAEIQATLELFLEQTESSLTYWVEFAGARSDNVTLCSAPSDVGESIGPALFRPGSSVVMTSATLSVGGSLAYFQQRIGGHPVRSMILDSPFNHARQMKLCLVRDIPEPESAGYAEELPGWIMRSVDNSGGRALVLFTSASLMEAVASRLRDRFTEKGITLLVQGAGRQRHALLEAFKADIRSVLFGLDSFWMGVDVPGEALEHVVITRLPFAVPGHPLVEARLEEIARRGGNAFLEYTLPEAVLKFRQGSGRLLRTRDDKGMVTILDSRVLKKQYGRVFIASLPPCPIQVLGASGDVEEISQQEW